MAADFRVHRRCAVHRLTVDMVHILDDILNTAPKRMVAFDARGHWLRWLTHATRGWYNSDGRTTFQSFCNTTKHLSVFIIQCSLLSSAPPHIWENVFQPHLQNESPLLFSFLYCVPLWRYIETSSRRLCWQLRLIRENINMIKDPKNCNWRYCRNWEKINTGKSKYIQMSTSGFREQP
jgi:hypothetical protein